MVERDRKVSAAILFGVFCTALGSPIIYQLLTGEEVPPDPRIETRTLSLLQNTDWQPYPPQAHPLLESLKLQINIKNERR